MSNCKVVRHVSRLGNLGVCRSLLREVNDGAWRVQRRPFSIIRLARGVHDVVGHALTMGEQAAGIRPTPSPAQYPPAEKPQAKGSRDASKQGFQNSKPSPSPWHISSPIPPTADPTTPTTLGEQVRSVMRLLPNPIVICTSIHGDVPRAMTMSSFTSLTLSPTPLVSFNIATPSRTLDAIQESRCFNIHITSGDANGVAMADRFTRGNTDDVFQGLEYKTTKENKAPSIQGDGILYVLRCRLLPDEPMKGLIKVRDHTIVVGEVEEMIPGSRVKEFGLAYADRKYRRVGAVISKE